MAINKKLIHFNTFENFNSKKLSANIENTQYTLGIDGEIQSGSPDILYQSIVYIKDTKQQWTHGQLYEGEAIVIKTTYSELVYLKENNKLIPGYKYRIIDYETIVESTSDYELTSNNNPFDIIVTANSSNVLNEDAEVCIRPGNNYFINNNLQSWKIKYCIDNNKTRFTWVKENVEGGAVYRDNIFTRDSSLDKVIDNINYFAFVNETDLIYSKKLKPSSSDIAYTYLNDLFYEAEYFSDYNEGLSGSKGVIYYMQDEFGNEAPYDFKNILIDSNYTFGKSKDDTISGNSKYNKINMRYNLSGTLKINNIILSINCCNNVFDSNCYDIFLGENCLNNIFNRNCYGINLLDGCWDNVFDSNCYDIFLGENSDKNIFGKECFSMTFSTSVCNSFGNLCSDNIFGEDCNYNTFGERFSGNILENNIRFITVGKDCYANTILSGRYYNIKSGTNNEIIRSSNLTEEEIIQIDGYSLKDMACKGKLIPGQRYNLYDYTRPFTWIDDRDLSSIGVTRSGLSPNIVLTAKTEYEFYSDATILSSSIPYAEEYKIKFDLCGKNHVLSTILEDTYSMIRFIHPNGTESTSYSFANGPVVYQYGSHTEIDPNVPWGFMRSDYTVIDEEPIREYERLTYFFYRHHGVITWMQDRNGNEAHCDWLSFDRITTMLNASGSELTCPIIPREGILWHRDSGINPIENNVISPYYCDDRLLFPTMVISSGYNNHIIIKGDTMNEYDSIISGNNNILENCRGMFFAENSVIKQLNCFLYDYDSDGNFHFYIRNSILEPNHLMGVNLCISADLIPTLRITNSVIKGSDLSFPTGLTGITHCYIEDVVLKVKGNNPYFILLWMINGNGIHPSLNISSSSLPLNLKTLNNISNGATLSPDKSGYIYEDNNGIVKVISESELASLLSNTKQQKVISLENFEGSISESIAEGEKVLFRIGDVTSISSIAYSQNTVIKGNYIYIKITNSSDTDITVGRLGIRANSNTMLQLWIPSMVDREAELIKNICLGTYIEAICNTEVNPSFIALGGI